MDCSKVLVMDAGRVAEFDEPWALLQRPDSLFSGMVQATGEAPAQQLRAIAQAAHDRWPQGVVSTTLDNAAPTAV
jgi:ABC-type proline/glycine betaine transport system ATPase subunit